VADPSVLRSSSHPNPFATTTLVPAFSPRQITRTLNESDPNTTLAETAYVGAAGTAQTITGTIASDATKLGLYIDEIGTCYIKSDSTSYACVVASGITGAVIKGVSQSHPATAVFAACAQPGPCVWPTNF